MFEKCADLRYSCMIEESNKTYGLNFCSFKIGTALNDLRNKCIASIQIASPLVVLKRTRLIESVHARWKVELKDNKVIG